MLLFMSDNDLALSSYVARFGGLIWAGLADHLVGVAPINGHYKDLYTTSTGIYGHFLNSTYARIDR